LKYDMMGHGPRCVIVTLT